MLQFPNDYLSSVTKEDGEGLEVAILYPIQDITPRIPPTAINTESCRTIGLHSEALTDRHKERILQLPRQKSLFQ